MKLSGAGGGGSRDRLMEMGGPRDGLLEVGVADEFFFVGSGSEIILLEAIVARGSMLETAATQDSFPKATVLETCCRLGFQGQLA